ncbi:LysR family transcriptional regulator [Neogemmobacter tilapiae]|uniref:LysR family transcriptional regulator n=1 Tax=Neogemmobacter tilapiae TaxID=875041 RepID=A0A918WJD6_9RHOB|nr:LysR family transcriptional regulator [Gemmobacter tilapiae]GHC51349.1 LysR family transcriptional regulator [Gemmobacter tilapiae]
MDRKDLNDMLWFMAVAEEQSFTRAAARLGTSQSTLSHVIRALETRLGLRLLSRTTRSVAPTEAGERLLRTLAPRIDEIESEVDALMTLRDRPTGQVRITLSDHAFHWIVWPKLRPMLQAYPDIRVELFLDNGFRNIVEERFDAGVRLGESLDQDMIAVRISPDWRLVAVAAPEYFERHPKPQVPHDLVNHDCINHRQTTSGGLYAWEFEKDGQELRVRVNGQLTFNSTSAMRDALCHGLGLGYVPEDVVAEDLHRGRLVQVLDDWSPRFTGYHLYYPSRRQNSAALSLVINTLR